MRSEPQPKKQSASSDNNKSSDNNIPRDVPVPTLKQTWTTAPKVPGAMVGNPPSGSGGNSNQPPPGHQPFSVYTGQIEDLENTLLSETQTRVDNYNNLKDYVNSTKSWIFTKPSIVYTYRTAPTWDTDGFTVTTTEDPDPTTTGQMTDISDNMLKGVADTLELVGQYIALLDNAAQIYASADIKSKLPPPSS